MDLIRNNNNAAQNSPTNITEFLALGRTFYFAEQPQNTLSTGTKLWDSGKILCKYLEKNRKKFRFDGKRVIELGAGCGLTGIVVAAMGAKQVFLTDQKPCLHLLKQNAARNEVDKIACTEELDWGVTATTNFLPPFDFVVGSDVLYQMESVNPLIEVLDQLADTKTVCLLSLEVRDEFVHKAFFERVEKFFTVSKVSKTKQHPEYVSPYCTIFQLRKHIPEMITNDSHESTMISTEQIH